MPKRRFWSLCLAAISTACGVSHTSSPPSYAEAPLEESAASYELPMEAEGEGALPSYSTEAYAGDMEFKKADLAPPMAQAAARRSVSRNEGGGEGVASTPGGAGEDGKHGAAQASGGEDAVAPMVAYTGFLELRVRRLLEAVDEITRITEGEGGYIESLTRDVVVVRIPASDFDAVMDRFAALGDVLSRRVRALDVSQQFTDLGARLLVAREARARLLELLEQTEDVEERLQILQEIKRLTEQLEMLQSRLGALRSLVDYFTITIELRPILDSSEKSVHRSAFEWVRSLRAHRMTIDDGKDEIAIELPKGFVFFDDDDAFRAQAADTTVIRAGRVENEPAGDGKFWSDAIHFEMDGRDEELLASGTAGPLHYRLYRSKDLRPRDYLIAVAPYGEDLYVVEVYYPGEKAFEAHHEAVLKALATFRKR